MSGRIVEGLWDCPYCGTKGIGGLTKHCPRCGHPQDKGTKFYMGGSPRYLDDELAKEYGQGADWKCDYCDSLNRHHFMYCANCGSPRGDATSDYFGDDPNAERYDAKRRYEEQRQAAKTPNQTARVVKEPETYPYTPPKGSGGGLGDILSLILNPIVLGIMAVLLVVGFLLMPKSATVTVEDMHWVRTVDVEDWRTVKENDWSVPDGGRVYDERSEIHHYDQVLDHYESRSRVVSEEVYDGEDTYTSYSDNGDGTFSEYTYSTPRYHTEYHTEYYDEPIYRDEPVYWTKYYYEIERWIVVRTEIAEGQADEPYWPELNLTGMEREGHREETYSFVARNVKNENKVYNLQLPYEAWKTLKIGQEIKVKYSGDEVRKIGDIDIQDFTVPETE